MQLSGAIWEALAHGSGVHGKRYPRTPRTCPLRAGWLRMSVSPSLHIPAPPDLAVQDCIPLWPRAFSQGSSLLHRAWCGACVAAGSRASSPDVNFGTPTPCCLARVLFTHWKPWIYCHCKQPHSGSQRHGAHAAFLPVAWETLPHPYLPSTPFSKGPIYFLACPSAFSRAAWLSKCYYNNTQCPLHSTVSIQGHWKVLSFCSSEVETFMILVSLGCK